MPVLPSYRNQSNNFLCKSIDWLLDEGIKIKFKIKSKVKARSKELSKLGEKTFCGLPGMNKFSHPRTGNEQFFKIGLIWGIFLYFLIQALSNAVRASKVLSTNLRKTLKNSYLFLNGFSAVNHFRKKLHFKCLTEFWIRYILLSYLSDHSS